MSHSETLSTLSCLLGQTESVSSDTRGYYLLVPPAIVPQRNGPLLMVSTTGSPARKEYSKCQFTSDILLIAVQHNIRSLQIAFQDLNSISMWNRVTYKKN